MMCQSSQNRTRIPPGQAPLPSTVKNNLGVGVALVLAFGVMLLISVSLSGLAARTVLSTALLFLVGGALLGPGGFGVVNYTADDEIVAVLADRRVLVNAPLAEVEQFDHPWVQEYFHGPRGRAAQAAQAKEA